MSENVVKVSSSLPRLKDDGTNWHNWKERAIAAIYSKPNLKKHLSGRAKRPVVPVEKDGQFYRSESDMILPLSSETAEALLDAVDDFDLREW
ncbi:hypothetical protein EV361DRAFT_804482, partial [Lentinula raphanica]